MPLLSTFRAGANVAVIGASGGLGRAFVEQLAGDDSVAHVHAMSRSEVQWDAPKVQGHRVDLTDEESISTAASIATGTARLDLVIVATGVLHRGPEIQPEKSLREIDPRSMADVLAINTLGPALIAKYFLPKLATDHKSALAVLSARVGSITDNRLGGWASYRMSKAALNMLVRTLAVEHARLNPLSLLISLHPGTVDTALSKPFTKRVDNANLFAPGESANKLLKVIDDLEPDNSGGFFAYDGSRIDY